MKPTWSACFVQAKILMLNDTVIVKVVDDKDYSIVAVDELKF